MKLKLWIWDDNDIQTCSWAVTNVPLCVDVVPFGMLIVEEVVHRIFGN